ncbi:MAG TPA: DUF2946 family protein [Rhizomicrobium sp.]|nr:DUF2946 family protein [Rhizomicrobium sp.]
MRRRVPRAAAGRAPGGLRLALALLITLSFALQATVTQTHIHVGRLSVTAGVVAEHPAPVKGKSSPVDNDSNNCPFCQEMLYAGHFVMPGAPLVALPVEAFSYVSIVIALPRIVSVFSHGWQGRAPPRP